MPVDDRMPSDAPASSAVDDGSLDFVDRMAAPPSGASAPPDRLAQEFARFSRSARLLAPAGTPLPSPEEMERLLRRLLGPFYDRLHDGTLGDYLNPDVLKGLFLVASYILRAQTAAVRRRMTGDYELDDFGRDAAFLGVVMPLAQALYDSYWRVEVTGAEHIPDSGRGLLVSNHSGVLPFDGAMLGLAVYNETPSNRLMRGLVDSWFPTLPFVSIFVQKIGGVQASPHNADLLLARDELVAVFPEGTRGVGKLYRDRYQLQRFGRGGFIRVALRTGAPIIPVAVVGAEEIYPVVARLQPAARLLGMPFFPITPLFPWTGPLGLVPLPSKWWIEFGEPIDVEPYGPRAAANPAIVARLSEQVRDTVQQMLLRRLARRRSVFLG
ncbi:MAG: lysophospholipid acyltransferase family protein [Chloroflexota bacterium]